MRKKRAENLKLVTEYFTGKDSFLPLDLSQMVLEFSGNLRVGKKSFFYITYDLPAFRGRLFKPIYVKNFRGERHPKSHDHRLLM
jgi:hypothetical protein